MENDMNRNDSVFDPYEFTDVVSGSVTYEGLSGQALQHAPNWRIKKIETSGTTTTTKYPNGDQSFSYRWDSRASYTYK